jgi:hypothetical protein
MTEEKISSKLPRQQLNVNPKASPPHPSMIVEITRINQFARYPIHASDPAARRRNRIRALQNFRRKRLPQQSNPPSPLRPELGAHLKPSLPVASPTNFLEPLFSRLKLVLIQGVLDHLVLSQRPKTNASAKPRHIPMPFLHMIPRVRINWDAWKKIFPSLQSIATGQRLSRMHQTKNTNQAAIPA